MPHQSNDSSAHDSDSSLDNACRCNARNAYRRALSSHPDLAALQEYIEHLDAHWPLSGTESEDRRGGGPSGDTGNEPNCQITEFGRFTIQKTLGEGGFGIVFLAHDPALGRCVALKLPRPEILLSESLRARFVREGRAAAALDHPNILPVFEAGDVGGIGYIVSSYCAGPTLAEWLADLDDPCPPMVAADIVMNLARAVHHAHQRGLLHRDVKPSNVLLESSNDSEAVPQYVPRLTDFGLAKQVGEPSAVTATAAQAGTPRYMAPEQLGQGGKSDIGVFTDVYSLGVVLYELLAGRVPFTETNALSLARSIQEAEPSGIRLSRPNVPRDLETICFKCLEKAPPNRYASAEALADDLQRFLDGREVLARPLGTAARWLRRCRRRPVVTSLLVLLLAALVGGVSGIAYQWRRATLYAGRLESHLVQAEQDLTNWAWVFEESHTLGYSNDLTSIATRERLRRHYARLLSDPVEIVASVPFQATRHAFAARLALLDDDHAGAERHLRESISQWQSLVVDDDSHAHSRSLAATLYLYSVLLEKTQRHTHPFSKFDGNANLFSALLQEEPVAGTVCAEYARLLIERGDALAQLARSSESMHAYRAASRLWDQLAERFPDNPEFKFASAESRLAEGMRVRQRHDPGEGVPLFRDAETIVESLMKNDNANGEYQFLLSQLRWFLGYDQANKNPPDAIVYFESSRTLLQAQAGGRRPAVAIDNLRILTARQLGDLYKQSGDLNRAIERYAEATTLAHPLALARQISRENADKLGEVHRTLGDLYAQIEEPENAIREWKHACHVFDNPLVDASKILNRDLAWAHCLEQIGKYKQQQDELDEAAIALKSARDILGKHIGRNPDRYQRIQNEIDELESSRKRISNPIDADIDAPIDQETPKR